MIACCVQRESEGPAATNGPACFSKWTELEDKDLSTSSETGNEKAFVFSDSKLQQISS